MAKAKKRKASKKPYHLSHHHHNASNNLLLILAGGFVVLVGVTYIMGTDVVSPKPQYQEVVAQEPVQEVAEKTISVNSAAYDPEVLTVKVGTKVTWVNDDLEAHSATADDGSFDTGVLQAGEKATITFDKPGTYGYYCIPHPYLRGTIVVEE
jgi:plastocyanin